MPGAELARPLDTFQPDQLLGNGSVGKAELRVGSQRLQIKETSDFPLRDGWSYLKRDVVALRRGRGDFRGRDGLEAGVGDGRNLLVAGAHDEARVRGVKVTGVDLDAWRAALASENLLTAGAPADRVSFLAGDVVGHLQAGEESITGWNLACLPQAPGVETQNHADGIDSSLTTLGATRDLALGPQTVDDYGLSLNAAYLHALRDRVDDHGSDVQVTLSGRIPTAVRGRLFTDTGWRVVEVYERTVPQDPDTGVAYVNKYATELDAGIGDGFFELSAQRGYIPVSPAEAEGRRRTFIEEGSQGTLNLHHKVFEYVAVPLNGVNPTEVKVYEI